MIAQSFERIHRSNLVGRECSPASSRRDERPDSGARRDGNLRSRRLRKGPAAPSGDHLTIRRSGGRSSRSPCRRASTRRSKPTTTGTAGSSRTCSGSCSGNLQQPSRDDRRPSFPVPRPPWRRAGSHRAEGFAPAETEDIPARRRGGGGGILWVVAREGFVLLACRAIVRAPNASRDIDPAGDPSRRSCKNRHRPSGTVPGRTTRRTLSVWIVEADSRRYTARSSFCTDPDSRLSMIGTARALSERGYRAVLVDLRGHGRSTGEWLTFGPLEGRDLQRSPTHCAIAVSSRGYRVYGPSFGGAAALWSRPPIPESEPS